MKNRQKSKKCKVYNGKSAFAKNLLDIMKIKNLTIQDVADGADVTRQTVYDWINGSIPRQDTIKALSNALGVSEDTIKYGNKRFDYDYFCERAKKKLLYSKFKDISLHDYLIMECGVDPMLFFISHLMPDDLIREKIARDLESHPEDLFIPVGVYTYGCDNINISHCSVLSDNQIDENEVMVIFSNLSLVNKKIVYNLCKDLLVSQS